MDQAPFIIAMAADARPRVVSVSPRGTAELAVVTMHAPIREIIDGTDESGHQVIGRLHELLAESRAQEKMTLNASLRLQERLRLSARMLTAFQAQLQRIETALGTQRNHEQVLRELEAKIEGQLSQAKSQLDFYASEIQARVSIASDGIAPTERMHPVVQATMDSDSGGSDPSINANEVEMNFVLTTMREVLKRVEKLSELIPASRAETLRNDD